MGEQALPGQFGQEDVSRDHQGLSQRGGHGPEPLRASEPSTWQRWLDVQPVAPVNDECPRERAVESLIQSERGQRWLVEISQGLRLSGSLRDLLHRRIRFLFIQGGRVARDLGMVDVDDQLIAALDSLRGDVWSCVLRDSTSPVTLLVSLDPSMLDRGLGPVGNIPIPELLWHFLAPLDFLEVTARDLGEMPEIFREGLIMARALVGDGVLRQCAGGGGGPLGANGYLFPIPKNAVKTSMIVHLVRLNKCHRFEPPRFGLPSVEDLTFLIQAHSMGLPNLSLGSPCLCHLNDPFLRELDSLRHLAQPGAPLLACHIDLTNAFWSLTLPEPFENSFRVRIDGKSYAFSCLPCGWRFSPVICQYVLAFVTTSVDTNGVIVLHYLDDFLVVGYGKTRVGSVARRLCDAGRRAGAVISTKNVLEPVPEIHRLGKWLVLCGGGTGVFPTGQGWGCFAGPLDPCCGLAPYPQTRPQDPGSFYVEFAPNCGVRPLFQWMVRPLPVGGKLASKLPPFLAPKPLALPPFFIQGLETTGTASPYHLWGGLLYVDAAFDVDRFKIGVRGPVVGGRVFPCSPGVCTQQEAELEALIRWVRLCIRVGWPVWRLIGDNSSALEQVASLRASAGLRRQNRHFRRLFFLLHRLEGSVYVEFVPRDLNPADSLSKVDSEWKG